MELMRAYADAVSDYLPAEQRKQQSDEIYDELCEQLEELAGTTRPSRDRQLDFLRGQPHPAKQAQRFSEPRYLIGPDYYLPYVHSLKIATAIVAVIHLFLTALDGLYSPGDLISALGGGFEAFVRSWLTVVAVITVVFVALERSGERLNWYDKWKPEDLLRQVGGRRVSQGETLFEAAVSLIVLLWWNNLVDFPSTVYHQGADLDLRLFPIGPALFWAVNALLVADLVNSAVKLFYRYWTTILRIADTGRNLGWMLLFGLALTAGDLVRLTGAADNPDILRLQDSINLSIDISLGVILAILAWDVAQHVRHIIRPSPTP